MHRTITKHHDLTTVVGYEDVLVGTGLESLDALFAVSNAESLRKPGLSPWRERLRLTLEIHGERQTFYLKRFCHPPRSARREVRRSETGASSVAGLEWAWMHRLASDGIGCVQPIAFGERLSGSTELRSAILTAAVPGDSLERWAAKWGESDRERIRGLIGPLAALVSRLHERGYVHRDLYLSHVFHDPAASPESSLRLIDVQRVLRPRWQHRRWIVKDLASLNFSAPRGVVRRADRLRWLTYYLGQSKLDTSARQLVYRVVGKTRQIARHEEHRAARWRERSEES